MTLAIRAATADDLDGIVAIEAACFGDPWSVDNLAAELDGDARRLPLVALEGVRMVGFAFYWVIADEIHLINVAVLPDFRRRGVAQALLDHVLDGSAGVRASVMTLEVRVTNAAAIALYRRNGFIDIALRPRYYPDTGEDALIMLKTLDEGPPGRL